MPSEVRRWLVAVADEVFETHTLPDGHLARCVIDDLEATMRTRLRLTTGILGLGLVLSACSDTPDDAEDAPSEPTTTAAADADDHAEHDDDATDDAHDHSAHGEDEPQQEDAGPVAVSIIGSSTGEFGEMAEGMGSATNTLVVEGTSTLTMTAEGSEVTIEADGLESGESYPAHLHDGSCVDFGGHYMNDPSGPMAPPNEIWASSSLGAPEAGLQPDNEGFASGAGRVDWIPTARPLSMMIHASELPGLPIACAGFDVFDAPVTLTMEPQDDDVESIEYAIDGDEWLTYEGDVELTEPGAYTVSVVAVDAAGERSEPQEIAVEVAG